MYNDIVELMQNYVHNCFTFTDKEVDESLVNDIIDKMYTLVPSKQAKMPWQVDILGPNRSEEEKKILYNWSMNFGHPEKNIPARPNPQSDAPYIFIFTPRYLTEKEIHLNTDLSDKRAFEKSAALEIGFAAYMLKTLANSVGLDFGFCGCIGNAIEMQKYYNKGNDWYPVLLCGIGYGTYEYDNYVTDYNLNKEIYFARPSSISKPEFSRVIFKHY